MWKCGELSGEMLPDRKDVALEFCRMKCVETDEQKQPLPTRPTFQGDRVESGLLTWDVGRVVAGAKSSYRASR